MESTKKALIFFLIFAQTPIAISQIDQTAAVTKKSHKISLYADLGLQVVGKNSKEENTPYSELQVLPTPKFDFGLVYESPISLGLMVQVSFSGYMFDQENFADALSIRDRYVIIGMRPNWQSSYMIGLSCSRNKPLVNFRIYCLLGTSNLELPELTYTRSGSLYTQQWRYEHKKGFSLELGNRMEAVVSQRLRFVLKVSYSLYRAQMDWVHTVNGYYFDKGEITIKNYGTNVSVGLIRSLFDSPQKNLPN